MPTDAWPSGKGPIASFVRSNGLSLAAGLLFVLTLIGQAFTGQRVAAEEAAQHGAPILGFFGYVKSGAFMEALFENWESEFLQMGLFVILTKFLRQKGSSESKPLEEETEVDEDPRTKRNDPNVPWPVRRGGIVLALYERSLFIALMLLFAASFVLHAVGGAREQNATASWHGEEHTTVLGYIATSRFWFESFQNWQSEFLSVAALVLLSIVLRERGSAQSKPVASPHAATGD
jgi:hypothetical protein